jgi:hypothetical protein
LKPRYGAKLQPTICQWNDDSVSLKCFRFNHSCKVLIFKNKEWFKFSPTFSGHRPFQVEFRWFLPLNPCISKIDPRVFRRSSLSTRLIADTLLLVALICDCLWSVAIWGLFMKTENQTLVGRLKICRATKIRVSWKNPIGKFFFKSASS